ncbi:hypothetical protein KDM41_14920, partial [bacterium]|nr:hypothetical protein [bacterium]
MRKAPCVILAAALTLLPTAPPARAADAPTSWQVHFRSTSYGLHTQDTAGGDEESHLLTYQTLSGGVQRLGADWLDLSGTWRYAGGDAPAAHLMPNEQRLYGALAEARVAPDLTVRAGRRFLQAGVASLFLDGASVDWRGGRTWQATAWGGGAAPQRLERMADFDQDAAAGAQIRWR